MRLLLLSVVLAIAVQEGWAYCRLEGRAPARRSCCNNLKLSQQCCSVDFGFDDSGEDYDSYDDDDDDYEDFGIFSRERQAKRPRRQDPCFCSVYSAPSRCFGFYPVTAVNDSHCCGQLRKRKICVGFFCFPISYYVYEPTALEDRGLCKRDPKTSYRRPKLWKPHPLPGRCTCTKEATSCFAPTTTIPPRVNTTINIPLNNSSNITMNDATNNETMSNSTINIPWNNATNNETMNNSTINIPWYNATNNETMNNSTGNIPWYNATNNETMNNSTINIPWYNATNNETMNNSTINIPWYNATNNETMNNSTINIPWYNATNNETMNNSTINIPWYNATNNETMNNSTINIPWYNATNNETMNNSTINIPWNNATNNLTMPNRTDTDTTGKNATTNSTTAGNATTPLPVCPSPPTNVTGRMLGGGRVWDQCTEDNILNFRAGPTQVCNGVLGYDPTTQSPKIFITDFCINFLKAVNKTKSLRTFGVYNSVPFPITRDTASTRYRFGISTIEPPMTVLLASRCQTRACVYNPATMSNIIDFNNCFISSFGYDIHMGGTVFNSGQLKKTNVTKETNCTFRPTSPFAQCFRAVHSHVQGCWGDTGAPVFCELTTTKETVLYGVVDMTGQPPIELSGRPDPKLCTGSSEFQVLPISKQTTVISEF